MKEKNERDKVCTQILKKKKALSAVPTEEM